jgi:hypothetical protein
MTYVVHLEDGSHPPCPPPTPACEALPHRVPPLVVVPGPTFMTSDDDDEIHYQIEFGFLFDTSESGRHETRATKGGRTEC